MLKRDQKSLEELSFMITPEQLASFKRLMDQSNSKGLLTVSDKHKEDLAYVLDQVAKLQLEGKVYAFEVTDSYAALQEHEATGVELYLRQGNKLEEYFSSGNREWVASVDDAIKFLKEKGVNTIYTGKIHYDQDFLGLNQNLDPDHPIEFEELEPAYLEEFESSGIKVVVLDSLI